MITQEEIDRVIAEIEQDVTYFKNIQFDRLSEKFKRDLNLIKSLVSERG